MLDLLLRWVHASYDLVMATIFTYMNMIQLQRNIIKWSHYKGHLSAYLWFIHSLHLRFLKKASIQKQALVGFL